MTVHSSGVDNLCIVTNCEELWLFTKEVEHEISARPEERVEQYQENDKVQNELIKPSNC